MPASATAGHLRDRLGFVWRLRSLRAKTAVLAVIFALVPIFLYVEFQKAYQDSQGLLPFFDRCVTELMATTCLHDP